MSIAVNCGDTYLINFAGAPNKHLFVVVTKVDPHTGTFILVGVETASNPHSENFVFIEPGDHPFIKHKSSVVYRLASIHSVQDLTNWVETGMAIPNAPMREDIVQRIGHGLLKSKHVAPYIQEFYNDIIWPLDK